MKSEYTPEQVKAVRDAMLNVNETCIGGPSTLWVGEESAEAFGLLGGAGVYKRIGGPWYQVEKWS